MSRPAAVTAVVLTYDEERHLPGCLATLQWSDEVLVVDSGSTDGTVAIAAAAGSRIATHPFENFSRQRSYALSLVTTPWALFVDADERVSSALAAELRGAAGTNVTRGYWIPRQNYFWGRKIVGGGWWPDYQLRLLAVGHCGYDPQRAVHEVPWVDGPTGKLAAPLIHLNYDDLAEFRSKQRSYAALEAARRRAAGETVRARNYVLQPAREVYRRYIALDGWRDGRVGLAVCLLLGWYELVTLRMLARPR